MIEFLRVPISLLPVIAFLSALIVLDSFQLVPLRTVLGTAAVGALAAGVCLVVNVALIEALRIDPRPYAKFLAPVVEEVAKASYVVFLIRADRVGFTVDVAIRGFAVGAGFAVVENLYYLLALEDPGLLVWVVRGFGTAILHGSTTAIFAMVSKRLADQRGGSASRFLPGLGAAILLHALFNQFVLPPALATAVIVAVFPVAVAWVFRGSERATREWLGSGFDADVEVLELIASGAFPESRIGRYLESLRDRFRPEVVADMFCMLEIHHELAIRAKAILLARQSGVDIPLGERVQSRLEELEYLKRSIGRTGRLALQPLLYAASQERWQLSLLESR